MLWWRCSRHGIFHPPHKTSVTDHPLQTYQWSRASDVGDRANAAFGDKPEAWNFTAHRVADLVIINLGTNDARTVNNVPSDDYYQSYVKMVENVHGVWPDAQIVLMVRHYSHVSIGLC